MAHCTDGTLHHLFAICPHHQAQEVVAALESADVEALGRWASNVAAFDALDGAGIANMAPGPSHSGRREAYASILTGDNPDYLVAALVLGSTVRSFDSQRDMLMLVSRADAPTRSQSEWQRSLVICDLGCSAAVG